MACGVFRCDTLLGCVTSFFVLFFVCVSRTAHADLYLVPNYYPYKPHVWPESVLSEANTTPVCFSPSLRISNPDTDVLDVVVAEQKIQRYKQEYMRRKVCIKDVGPKGIGLVAKVRRGRRTDPGMDVIRPIEARAHLTVHVGWW